MFQAQTFIIYAVIYYDSRLGTVIRRDLATHYTRMMAEQLAEDNMNIGIKNGWVERPPQADKSEDLMNH